MTGLVENASGTPDIVGTDDNSGPNKRPTRYLALHFTASLIRERGLGVSMDEVAIASGIGRRTLFRYFPSRDAMVAMAVANTLDQYETDLAGIPVGDMPLHDWLRGCILTVHQAHIDAGRGLWEIAALSDDALATDLRIVNRRRRDHWRAFTVALAEQAWARAGGHGEVPAEIVEAVALSVSSFATQSMLRDFGTTLESVATTTAMMLELFLTE